MKKFGFTHLCIKKTFPKLAHQCEPLCKSLYSNVRYRWLDLQETYMYADRLFLQKAPQSNLTLYQCQRHLDHLWFFFFSFSDIFDFIHPDELSQKIQAMSTFNDHFGDSKPVYHNDILRCYAYIPPSDQYAVRVNTLSQYCSINRQVTRAFIPLLVYF